MFTPFDTAHLTHRAARHVPASEATRKANRQRKEARRAAFRSVFAPVFALAQRHPARPKPATPRG